MNSDITTVLFDFGGVITTSPFEKFARYEEANDLPKDLIRKINSTNPDSNAWAQLERSAVDHQGFCELFEAEGRALGFEVSGRSVLECLVTEIRPFMVDALIRIHQDFQTVMLTNNFSGMHDADDGDDAEQNVEPEHGTGVSSGASFADIATHFDHIIESAVVGIRKPDPEIYRLTCDTAGVAPHQVVFLDDLGINLKPARAMGMSTIKVVDPHVALNELTAILGLDLTQ